MMVILLHMLKTSYKKYYILYIVRTQSYNACQIYSTCKYDWNYKRLVLLCGWSLLGVMNTWIGGGTCVQQRGTIRTVNLTIVRAVIPFWVLLVEVVLVERLHGRYSFWRLELQHFLIGEEQHGQDLTLITTESLTCWDCLRMLPWMCIWLYVVMVSCWNHPCYCLEDNHSISLTGCIRPCNNTRTCNLCWWANAGPTDWAAAFSTSPSCACG